MFQGKFGQRSTLSKQEYFTEPVDFFKLVCDESNEIIEVLIVNEHMVRVTHRKVNRCLIIIVVYSLTKKLLSA